MKIAREKAVAMMLALGFEAAGKWSDARLVTKLNKLPTLLEEDHECKDEDAKASLNKVLAALKEGGTVELKTAEAAEADPKPSKKGSKKAPAPAAEEEDEEDEDEDEDEEEEDEEEEDEEEEDDDDEEEDDSSAKKTSKKGSKKEGGKKKASNFVGAGGEGKPGIIASIVEFVTAATEEKPISKKRLLEKLVKRFPQRASESMARTINVQVPGRLKADKGLNVIKNDKGFYVGESKKESKKASTKAKASAKAKAEDNDEDEDDED